MVFHARVDAIAASEALDRVAFGMGDGQLFLLERDTGAVCALLRGHAEAVRGVAFVGDTLVSVDESGWWIAWDARDGARRADGDTHHGAGALVCAVGARAVVTAGADARLRVREPHDGALRTTHALPSAARALAALDDTTCAVGLDDGRVLRVDVDDAAGAPRVLDVPGVGPVGACAAFRSSEDGSVMLAVARGAAITVVDVARGAVQGSWAHGGAGSVTVRALVVAPSGKTLWAQRTDHVVDRFGFRPAQGGGAWLRADKPEITGACGGIAVLRERTLAIGEDDNRWRVSEVGSAGRIACVLHASEHGDLEHRDGIGGRNPGMWRSVLPPPKARAHMEAQSKHVAAALLAALQGEEPPPLPPELKSDPPRDARVDRLYMGGPEERVAAAEALGEDGPRWALDALVSHALHDQGGFSVEGAFVDSYDYVYPHAARACAALLARHGLDDEAAVLLRGVLAGPRALGVPFLRVATLFEALGASARALLDEACAHPDARVRARALRIRAGAGTLEAVFRAADDDVREQLAREDAYGGAIRLTDDVHWHGASARVRRALCELWWRHQHRMGGSLAGTLLVRMLDDDDAVVRARAARELHGSLGEPRPPVVDGAHVPLRACLETRAHAEPDADLRALYASLQKIVAAQPGAPRV